MDIRSVIREVISAKCYMDPNDIDGSMTMEGDLFVDSFGFMAIIVEIEERLSLRLPVEEAGLSVKCSVDELCGKIEAYRSLS